MRTDMLQWLCLVTCFAAMYGQVQQADDATLVLKRTLCEVHGHLLGHRQHYQGNSMSWDLCCHFLGFLPPFMEGAAPRDPLPCTRWEKWLQLPSPSPGH